MPGEDSLRVCTIQDGAAFESKCCPREHCSHSELARVETPDDPMEHRVENAGRLVAATCPSLNRDQLRNCFGRIFQITTDCKLYDLFSAAYKTERAALDEL